MAYKKTVNTLLAGAVALTIAGAAGTANAIPEGHEKCYGVAKAGMNDCGAADKSHSCAGHAATDGDWKEWVAVPSGLCDKLAGGSTTPVEHAATDAAHDAANDAMDKAKDMANDAMDKVKSAH